MDQQEGNGVEYADLIVISPSRQVKGNSGWSKLLLLAAAATTLGSAVPAGYNIGVVNNPEQVIKHFCNTTIIEKYGAVLSIATMDVLWSCIVSIFIVGGVIGSLTGGWLADKYGRKGSIMIADGLGLIAAICFVASKEISSVELLLLGRLVVGISSGLITGVAPMYLTELSPLCLRGPTGVLCPLGVTIGVLFAQILGLNSILGTDQHWHWLLAAYSLPTIFCAMAFPILPESPKYLFVVSGDEEQAIRELERIRGVSSDKVTAELEVLKEGKRDEHKEKTMSSKAVLSDKKLLLPLLLVITFQAGQQLSGVNAVFYYSSRMFEKAGLTPTQAQLGSIGAGVVNLTAATLAVYTMNRFRRRPLFLISCLGAALSLGLLVISIVIIDESPLLRFLPIIAVLLYIFLYGIGLGPIPYFIGSELFDISPRPVAMAWGSMANWAGNFVVGMSFPSINNIIGAYVFLFNIIIVLLVAYFIWLYFPETKGVETRLIAAMLQDGFKSKIRPVALSTPRLR